MQFPDTEVTRETEAIMQAIAPFGTYSDTSKYNRAYEAIWTLLTDIAARPGATTQELCECGQPENSIRHSFSAASSIDAHEFRPALLSALSSRSRSSSGEA